jgi:solute carrier family 66 (lysosomal lysine-arginine transporter), member 1
MRNEQDPLLTSENHRVDNVVPAWLLVVRYFGALAFVVVVGVAAWWVTDNEEKSDFIKPDEGMKWWIIQLLGWSSALLFVRVYFYPSGSIHLISFPLQLGARIPQIC